MPERKRVLICVPRWGVDPPECMDYRHAMCYQLGAWEGKDDCPYSFDFGSVPDLLVQLARELCAKSAIEKGFDYLGMIDDDMIGPVDEHGVYINLWRRLLDHDVDIVAPLAFMRNVPHYPVCYAVRGGWDDFNLREAYTHDVILNYPKQCLFECDAVGFGAVLIKVEVLKGIGAPWFMSTNPSGEDVLFCNKAKKKGYRIFMDTTLCLKHLGPRQYIDESYFESTNGQIEELRESVGNWTREKARNNLAS